MYLKRGMGCINIALINHDSSLNESLDDSVDSHIYVVSSRQYIESDHPKYIAIFGYGFYYGMILQYQYILFYPISYLIYTFILYILDVLRTKNESSMKKTTANKNPNLMINISHYSHFILCANS